jgi:hypothetical protein
VISVAVVAYAACDMLHEVLGHGLACALIPGVRALSLTTVALQTSAQSRMVAAAGSIANVIVGALLFALLRRGTRFDSGKYFLWLLATLNLLNGTGYLLFSGILDVGDWSVVIAGLEPHGVWRAGMALGGIVAYAGVISISAARMSSWVRDAQVDRGDVTRLVFPAYVAGGLLLVAGAAVNPIDPSLIFMSGLSSGFGAMAGLVLVPKAVERQAPDSSASVAGLRASRAWLIAAIVVAVVFVGVIGRGINFTSPS